MMLELLHGPLHERMGPPLVQLDYSDWTASIHQDDRLGLLWVRDLVLNDDGRRSRFISRAQDKPSTPHSFVRLGGSYRGNRRSIGGKLPVRATGANGYCDSGLPVVVSVEGDLFCAIMPRYEPVVLRFWEDDGGSVQEYRVSKDIEQPELYSPWWARLTYWVRTLIGPPSRGVATYNDKKKWGQSKYRFK